MSNPQVEDGYTRIANELMDALCKFSWPGAQPMKLALFILRKTYGFNKPADAIPLSQFSEATGIPKHKVCEVLGKLAAMGVIVVTPQGNKPAKVYAINKDYEKWQPLPSRVTLPHRVMSITPQGKKSYPTGEPQKTKDNSSKDKKIKRLSPVNSVTPQGNNLDKPKAKQPVTTKQPDKELTAVSPEISEFVTAFQQHIVKIHKRQAPKITPGLINGGCDAVEKLIRLDGYTLDEIKAAMRWAVEDEFWSPNARSLAGLRKKGSNGLMKIQNIVEAQSRGSMSIDAYLAERERRQANA